MGMLVVNGAMIMCSFGMAPGTLTVLPIGKCMANKVPAANIMDNKPMMNVAPFGSCMSMANPMVAAATAAALGVLTPMPCIPMTMAPWIVGSPTVMVAKMPALNDSSTLMCNWGGVVTISMPGQFTVMVP
jgi:hypothetical protein